MNKRDWDKAAILLRSAGAGTVTVEDGVVKQQGKSPLQFSTTKGTPHFGLAMVTKTAAGSMVAGMDKTGSAIGIFPIWKQIFSLLFLNPVTLKWLLKRLLGFNKIRQK